MSRIILKISGEALKGNEKLVDDEKLLIVLKTIKLLQEKGHQIGVVIGGGNFFRGREHEDMDKVTADTIGMLGTVMNALYLKDYLAKKGIKSIIDTPFTFPSLMEKFSEEELREKYQNGEVIIFGGGVGKSGFSTDSGTILASQKLKSDLIIKMTNVDGVYSDDPRLNKDAIKFDKLTYQEVIDNDYKVMDAYAFQECKKNNIKILVMNYNNYENILDYFSGKNIGTVIGN